MPAPKRLQRTAGPAMRYNVALEPAISMFGSLMLLNAVADVSGLGDWIVRTAAALPPEVARRNRLVLQGLYFAILPGRQGLTFPAYIDDLAAAVPEARRDRLLRALAQHSGDSAAAADGWSRLLDSVDDYLTFLQRHFPPENVDVEIETEVFALLKHPGDMQAVIVSHLRQMWDDYLAAEWERCTPLLQESVDALRQVALDGYSAIDAVRRVTGHELLGEQRSVLGHAHEIVFVPSLHTGPYLHPFCIGDLSWLIFGAWLPEEGRNVSSDLARSDLLVRLDALADDTRLRILALLRAQGEQCSQDIMTQLRLTQSATSRHLRQLAAAGYVVERRRDAAKCYSLNRDRMRETLRAVERFVAGG
jgi:DNA-binding transcriptional ArsR family regulator